MDEVNVIGLGYIGLPTALMFASSGVRVIGTDCKADVVEMLNKGELPFDETGMNDLFLAAKKNNIEFSSEYKKMRNYVVAVPTPFNPETKLIDESYIVKAVKQILEVCSNDATVVIESTVAPGTIEQFVRPIIESSGKTIHIAHAPERILPGQMLYELNNNSRTIGVDDEETGRHLKALYSSFCRGEIIVTDIKTAEMTKVIENTYRDINIAFANELATICRDGGMDVYEVIRIANKHPRVSILSPGPGVGGHCIAVDPWFLVGRYKEKAKLIRVAREVNDNMPSIVAHRIEDLMKENGVVSYEKVGLYGLTYKENINDVRESPTLQLLSLYKEQKDHFCVYDPYVKTKMVDGQVFDMHEFVNRCDFVVIMIGHDEIKNNSYILNDKIVLDTRNIAHNLNHLYHL
ncbi:MAG TPA: nucleotide sugar dehydrogenase [Clostridiales bacterium]|nr:nucleotide sugar dehydrogenase [Clostridiales bacterium]